MQRWGRKAYPGFQEPQSIDYSSQEDEKTGLVSEMEIDDTLSVNDGTFGWYGEDTLAYTRTVPAFVERNLSDFGHEVIDFQTYTWNLAHWTKLDRRIQSPVFHVGGHPWYGDKLD